MNDKWQTRDTLLKRVRDPDNKVAWEEFIGYYSSFIDVVLRKLSVPSDDLDDLRQDVLLALWKSIKNMELGRNGAKFRTWIGAVIGHTVSAYRRRLIARQRREAQVAVPDYTNSELEELIEQEWTDHLSSLVMARLASFFSGKAIKVFRLSMAGSSTDAIAAELDLTRDSVYVLKNRVRTRFIREAKLLRRELEFDA